jgi:hypothetical protein
MRKFTITFRTPQVTAAQTVATTPEPITIDADDVNMGVAGQTPCLVFIETTNLVTMGVNAQSQGAKIIHIIPLENVLSCVCVDIRGSASTLVQ